MTQPAEPAKPAEPADGTEPDVVAGEASSTPPRRTEARSPLRGCLQAIGIMVLLVIGLGVIGILWIYVSFSQGNRPAEARPAPVIWKQDVVVLDADRPLVHGRLTISVPREAAGAVALGLDAGLPQTQDSASSSAVRPGAVLSGPVVRVTLQTSGAPGVCLAPCELPVPWYACGDGGCSQSFEFQVEIDAGSAPPDGSVRLAIAGGVTGDLTKGLAPGCTVDLVIDAAVPRAAP